MEFIGFALAIGAIYSLISVGFALVFSILNFSNFSHGVVMAVGAYTGYFIMAAGRPWYVALLGAGLCCGVMGVLIEFLAFRKLRISNGPIIYLFVASITVLMLVQNILSLRFGGWVLAYPPLFNGASISLGSVKLPVVYALMITTALISLALLSFFLVRTKQGIAIRAAAKDLKTCSLMGIKINVLISLVFFISGLLGGFAGMFFGMTYSVFPQVGSVIVKGWMAVIIGGMGSLGGAVLGSFFLAFLETGITFIFGSNYAPIGLFLIVVTFLVFRPQGIAGVSSEHKV
jgi:branched-chain amino acid transport system permease protein